MEEAQVTLGQNAVFEQTFDVINGSHTVGLIGKAAAATIFSVAKGCCSRRCVGEPSLLLLLSDV
jgi:hypothetical protein